VTDLVEVRMRFYEAAAHIDAAPAEVWTVLADATAWPGWDSGVESVQGGGLALGQTLTIRSKAAPGRSFPVRVEALDPPRRAQLCGGMPLGLFRGVRTFTVDASAGGGSSFLVREEYTGPLLALIWRSMPDLGPSFDQFAAGLKARVERGG
jgi:hypothetical protein